MPNTKGKSENKLFVGKYDPIGSKWCQISGRTKMMNLDYYIYEPKRAVFCDSATIFCIHNSQIKFRLYKLNF